MRVHRVWGGILSSRSERRPFLFQVGGRRRRRVGGMGGRDGRHQLPRRYRPVAAFATPKDCLAVELTFVIGLDSTS